VLKGSFGVVDIDVPILVILCLTQHYFPFQFNLSLQLLQNILSFLVYVLNLTGSSCARFSNKIIYHIMSVVANHFFLFGLNISVSTRRHQYKLYQKRTVFRLRIVFEILFRKILIFAYF